MLFSIVVPVYNVEKYLNRCVDSLIGQTFGEIEIILVDDGSKDGSPKICDEYAKKDKRIKVIHKPNGGLSDARNTGLIRATGDYVLFVDSDDWLTADAVEKFAVFTNSKYDLIVGDGEVIGTPRDFLHIEKKGEYSGIEFLKESTKQSKMPMAAVLNAYRREFLLENQLLFKVGILHEDENFTPKVLLKAKKIYNSGISFYNYFIHEGTITTRRNMSKNASDLYDTCCELASIYKKLSDKQLKRLLLDSLVVKYLSLFQAGKIYQYGRKYIHKNFVLRYSYRTKTRLKAILFVISCKLYYKINALTKA